VTTTAAIPAVKVDERISGQPLWKRLMIRPEFGALSARIWDILELEVMKAREAQ